MKIFQKAVALMAAAAVALSVCVSCDNDATVKRIKQNGGLRVGYCSSAPSEDEPFVIDGGEGLTGEPAGKVADSMGVDAIFSRCTTAEAYDWLMSGRLDCLWNCPPPVKELVSSVRTIETGLYYRQVIVTGKDSKISRLADVKGKKLAVVSGSDAQAELHNAAVMESSLKETVVCGNMQEVLELLDSGKVHCAAVDEPQAVYAIAKYYSDDDSNGHGFRFIDTPIAESGLVIVTRAEDADLCSKIAEKFVSMSQDGKIRAICEKYNLTGMLSSAIKNNPEETSV